MTQWWLSTSGFLGLLSAWCWQRRLHSQKNLSLAVLQAVITQSVSPELAGQIVAREPPELACDCVDRVAGQCRVRMQAREFVQERATSAEPTLLKLARLVAEVWCWRGCPSMQAYIQRLFIEVAASIDARSHTWGDAGWTQSEHAVLRGPCRARRYDDEVKAEASKALETGTKRFLEEVCSKSGVQERDQFRIVRQSLSKYKKLCAMAFAPHKDASLSLATDASRFGKPLQEYLALQFGSCSDALACAGTPEVCPLVASRKHARSENPLALKQQSPFPSHAGHPFCTEWCSDSGGLSARQTMTTLLDALRCLRNVVEL